MDEIRSGIPRGEVKQEVDLAIFMTETTLFRKQLTSDFSDVKVLLGNFAIEMRSFEKTITALPCKERKSWYEGMGKQVAFMWLVIAIFLSVGVTSIVKANVAESKAIAAELLVAASSKDIKYEIEQIKKVSYGYQDYLDFLKSRQAK